jgi:hypothetical protein
VNRFIILSFLVMGWAYWELSGGSDFVAQQWPEAEQRVAEAESDDATPYGGVEIVTRADTTTLASFEEIAPPATPSLTESAIAAALEDVLGTPSFEEAAPAELAATTPETAPEAPEPEVAPVVTAQLDLREVNGDRVNLREGPGTNYGVIDQLVRGTVIEVVETGFDGWVRIRIDASGRSGWMSDQFLVPMNG